jgi:hypothetical protein
LCGGCSPARFDIVCERGKVGLSEAEAEALDLNVAEGCALVGQRLDRQNEGGAGGNESSTGRGSGAGGETHGVCATYVDPGPTYQGFDGYCINYSYEGKAGECVLDGECCVVVASIACFP